MYSSTEFKISERSACCLLFLICFFISGSVAAQDIQTRNDGPKNLFITYRCNAASRGALRNYLTTMGVTRFAEWKKQGVLGEYRVFFNWFVDADTWDGMVILTFRNYDDVLKWKTIEQSFPGGLDAAGLAIATPVTTYPADLIWHGRPSTPVTLNTASVFLIIPYTFYPPTSVDEYIKYGTSYVLPQVEGWVREGALASFAIYINRFPSARRWQSMFVLEYKDIHAFAAREKIVSKITAELKDNPAWKAYSDIKLKIRTEKEAVTAEELHAP